MTALDEVLKTEKEAEKSIEEANEKALAAVAEARDLHKEKLETVDTDFANTKESEIKKQEEGLKVKVSDIEKKSDQKVSELKEAFSTKKGKLLETLKSHFIK